MAFITAYSKSTGREHYVPEHFFDSPELCRDLTRDAPPGAEPEPDQPSLEWTVAQLKDYAAAHGIDLAGASVKQQIFDAIEARVEATQAAEHVPGDDGTDNPAVTAIGVAHPAPPTTTETPATGENQE